MTSVYITIDTEYSAGLTKRQGRDSRAENFDSSIRCATPTGDVGVSYQMDVFDRYGLKAVFFVDPMPALLWGVEAIADVVGPIVSRGHDVQLHLHTEWLELAGSDNPVCGRTGLNIKDYTYAEQVRILDFARSTLIAAGAPAPVAFRAGNYGANDDTLQALAALGIGYDTSHCPGYAGSLCGISLGKADMRPLEHCGVTEVPVACIAGFGEARRHAQITALSSGEMLAAIRHARDSGIDDFTLVSHSFELLSRDRLRTNRIVKRRFEAFCKGLSRIAGAATATYRDAPPPVAKAGPDAPLLPHNPLRTGLRMAEQALVNALYGERKK